MSSRLPRPTYKGDDSRVYSTARLPSFHGFDERPVVDDGMLFRLPPIRFYHSREIIADGRRWMIWSANSSQDPYYPGPRAAMGASFRDPDLTQRRYDGRGGRWDYTRVPQSYSAIRPWLGFIHREGTRSSQDVEYTSVYSVWDTVNAYQVGRLQEPFMTEMVSRNNDLDRQMTELLPQVLARRPSLCPYRPKFPTRDVMAGLAAAEEYERAVDIAAECQAGMKEKCAWITMARCWLDRPFLEPYVLDSLTIVPANEDFLGVWINGAPAEDPLWYLVTAAVPCFVISELPREGPSDRVVEGFLWGTDVERIRHSYEFDRLGSLGGVTTPLELRPLAATPVPRTPFERRRAGLRWQMDIPEGRWLAATVPATDAAPPSDVTNAPESDARMELDRRSPTASAASSCESIAPPPVAPPARSYGSWTIFVEDENDDQEPRMRKRGGRQKGKADLEGEQEMWYDRTLKRKLIFDDLPPAPRGFPADEEYGRPVPEWPFGMDSNGRWLPETSSMWMYKRENPTPGRIGELPDVSRAASAAPREDRDEEMPLRNDIALIFEDDIAPMVPVSPSHSDRTERPRSASGEVSSRDATPLPETGIDVRMSSPLEDDAPPTEVSSPAVPLVLDHEGRAPTSFVLLRGIPASWTEDSLRRWTRTMGTQNNPLRLRQARRVFRNPRVDVLVEFFDEHDAQVFMVRANGNLWVSRGAVYVTAASFGAAIARNVTQNWEGPSAVLQNSLAFADRYPSIRFTSSSHMVAINLPLSLPSETTFTFPSETPGSISSSPTPSAVPSTRPTTSSLPAATTFLSTTISPILALTSASTRVQTTLSVPLALTPHVLEAGPVDNARIPPSPLPFKRA
ncbi:hypothetical protein B0H15DRAFT_799299 [Mycena belliarum]|uniref:Uncharacterized protein n=1 Tax=Mycena belliarum TaxID=1033014 RepID=A0AAD6U7D0_9AGAR|nr:hypothetical protein B0H15DRAFT_799299 [Mycena belliae]